MSNELPWQVWTPDDLAPPPETFVPVEADNVTLTDDTPEPNSLPNSSWSRSWRS